MSDLLAVLIAAIGFVWIVSWQFVLPMVGLFYILGWLA